MYESHVDVQIFSKEKKTFSRMYLPQDIVESYFLDAPTALWRVQGQESCLPPFPIVFRYLQMRRDQR